MTALRGYGYALGSAVLVGTVNVVSKHGIELGADPLALVAAAYVLAALLLAPWALKFRFKERRDVAPVLVSSVIGAVVAPAFLFFGLARTTAVTASLLTNLEMFFTAIMAATFLGERLRGREAFALAAIAAGAVFVAIGPDLLAGRPLDPGNLIGAALVGGASASWAVDSVMVTPLTRRYGLRSLLGLKFVIGGIGLTAITLATTDFASLVPMLWPHVAYNTLGGVIGSILLLYAAFRSVGATRAIVLFATAGFWGAITARVFLGEPLTAAHLVGGGIMIAGVVGLTRSAHIVPAPSAAVR